MTAMPEETQSGMIGCSSGWRLQTNPLTKICHSVEQ